MLRFTAVTALAVLTMTGTAKSDAPRVVADIAPVHGLVSQVMQGIGAPELLLRQNVSPHDYAMRPSEAAKLEQADLVIWTGAALTPWLGDAVNALAPDAQKIELMALEATNLREFRTGLTGESVDHSDHEDHGDHETHDDHEGHDDHGHDTHDDHEGHGDHEDEHEHDGDDPHVWLDPENAKAWLVVIADALAAADPENAQAYQDNARRGQDAIDVAVADVVRELSGFQGVPYVVLHDAYQYFEVAFDLAPVAAISLGDAARPGPARLSKLREQITQRAVGCVFSEPQLGTGAITTLFEGLNVVVAELDPMGATLETGPQFYPDLLRGMARQMSLCKG